MSQLPQSTLEDLAAAPIIRPLHHGRNQVDLIDGGEHGLLARKRWRYPMLRRGWYSARRGGGKAGHHFQRANDLLDVDFRIPQPFGILERHPFPTGGVAFNRFIDAPTLRDLILQYPEQLHANPSLPWENIGRVIGGLHAKGFVQTDCNASNFLVAEDGIYLVDLNRIRRMNPTANRQAWCLMQLLPDEQQLVSEFLDGYRQAFPSCPRNIEKKISTARHYDSSLRFVKQKTYPFRHPIRYAKNKK